MGIHIYCSFIHSLFFFFPAPHHPTLAPSRLLLFPSIFWENHSLNWKRDPGATSAGSDFFFFFFSLWIIDSRCLVIHRLHMPANSSGEEKLPTSQPCMPHRPNTPQTHTHTQFMSSHTSTSHICMHTYTNKNTHTPFRVEFSPLDHHHHHPHLPQKSQELGMRGGSKRQVSG